MAQWFGESVALAEDLGSLLSPQWLLTPVQELLGPGLRGHQVHMSTYTDIDKALINMT